MAVHFILYSISEVIGNLSMVNSINWERKSKGWVWNEISITIKTNISSKESVKR